jgi:hypothetical protein
LRPIEGDDGRSSVADVLEKHGILGFVEVRRRFGINSSPPLGGIWWDDRLRSFLSSHVLLPFPVKMSPLGNLRVDQERADGKTAAKLADHTLVNQRNSDPRPPP